ncbi:MAG: phosphotransferase [Ornithinimicrobium sp.]
MRQPENGELLAGGSQRRIVRVGSTVRIPAHDQSAYIADLLRHLERVGFEGAPRWLGRTHNGHELLTYVEGTVPADPPYNFDDAQLVAASDLVLRFHDAVAETPLCRGAQTVCHGDLGPHNTVFRDGRPIAIIDWDDDVGPGLRAVDFADAVWGFADVTSDTVPVAEQARRVGVMCDAYPGMTPAIIVAELRAQLERARSNHKAAGRTGPREVFEGLIARIDRHGPTIAADR